MIALAAAALTPADNAAAGEQEQPPPPTAPVPGEMPDRKDLPRSPREKPVFDETWATVGIGAGLVPSYSGSDDYVLFPLPLIVGRVAGIGVTPNGPGFNLNLFSPRPSRAPPETAFSFGPSFRFRNDRAQQTEDEILELATELDVAIEVGVNGGVSIPGVLWAQDRLAINTQVRWDIAGAHDGMLFEPGIAYFTPLSRGAAVQLAFNASFVDDDFADYYYTVTPGDAEATGLAEFTADGGLNSLGAVVIGTVDLNGNLLDGGFNIYSVAGYSRLVGDAAETPFTDQRGSANQFIGGIGVGYTF
jgi:outer membrane scaffolding protein for murein synthesis (MipA/OmpV family)